MNDFSHEDSIILSVCESMQQQLFTTFDAKIGQSRKYAPQ